MQMCAIRVFHTSTILVQDISVYSILPQLGTSPFWYV